MFNMSDASHRFLEKYVPQVLKMDDLDTALLELDAFITKEGLDSNDDMTEFGHEAQSVFDDIYENNDYE